MHRTSSFLILWSLACAAPACLNDTSTSQDEEEFRSQYGLPSRVVDRSVGSLQPAGVIGIVVGSAMLGAAFVIRWRKGTLPVDPAQR